MIKIIFLFYIFIIIKCNWCFKTSYIDQNEDTYQIEQKIIEDNSDFLEQKVIFGNDKVLDNTDFQNAFDENNFLQDVDNKKNSKKFKKKQQNETFFEEEKKEKKLKKKNSKNENDITDKKENVKNEIFDKNVISIKQDDEKDNFLNEDNLTKKDEKKVFDKDEEKNLEKIKEKTLKINSEKNLKKVEENELKKDDGILLKNDDEISSKNDLEITFNDKIFSKDENILIENQIKKKDKKKKKQKVKFQSSVNITSEDTKVDNVISKNLKNDEENDKNFNNKSKKKIISPGKFLKKQKEKKEKSIEETYSEEIMNKKQKKMNKLKKYDEIRKIDNLGLNLRLIKEKNLILIEELDILEYRCRKNRLYFFDTLWRKTAKKFKALNYEIDDHLNRTDFMYKKFSKLFRKKEKSLLVTESLENEFYSNRLNLLNLEKDVYNLVKEINRRIEETSIIKNEFEKEFFSKI